LRLGIAVVFLFWSLDKLVNAEHAKRVASHFYGLDGATETVLAVMGVAQLALTAAFAAGVAKRATYGAVLGLHAISTLSSYAQYLDPFENLLFFAAWPMLAACVALYLLRSEDTLGTVKFSGRTGSA
jgi:hypothetical protein